MIATKENMKEEETGFSVKFNFLIKVYQNKIMSMFNSIVTADERSDVFTCVALPRHYTV